MATLIQVKTGEEEEDSLFSERCKLFRFAGETKEWKERGLGDFKILRNRETGRVRFLMRREQVLKICCNHFLTADMEITPLQTSDRAWTWTAPDFAEGEVKNELFALKFKTAEMAANWKKVVDTCKKELTEKPPKAVAEGTKVEEVPVKNGAKKTDESKAVGTLAQFAAAQKASSWECSGCLTRNDNTKIQCLACEAAKPGHEEEVKKLKEAAAKPAATVMTLGAGGGFKFDSLASATATSVPSSGFTFGSLSTTPAGSTNGGFGSTSTSAPLGQGFTFSGLKPAVAAVSPPAKSPGRKHNESTTSENELYQDEEEGDNLYFEPVVPLPDRIDVKTGEEEETVLYAHRAKVYRFTDGEWKERGVGDIKAGLRIRTLLIWYESGSVSSMLGWIPIRIQSGSRGFDDQKLKIILQIFLDQNYNIPIPRSP